MRVSVGCGPPLTGGVRPPHFLDVRGPAKTTNQSRNPKTETAKQQNQDSQDKKAKTGKTKTDTPPYAPRPAAGRLGGRGAVAKPWPNMGLQPTAYSLRSSLAPASGSG
jgi:hypothetical protein